MAWQQIREGEGVDAGFVVGWLGEEVPGEKLRVFDLTVGTIFGDGSLICDTCGEQHLEGLEIYFGIGDCEEELARKEGTGRCARVAIEDERR